jgi:hypothetical protein
MIDWIAHAANLAYGCRRGIFNWSSENALEEEEKNWDEEL